MAYTAPGEEAQNIINVFSEVLALFDFDRGGRIQIYRWERIFLPQPNTVPRDIRVSGMAVFPTLEEIA